jgi:hypothetical protein
VNGDDQRDSETFRRFRKRQSELYGLDRWIPVSDERLAEERLIHGRRGEDLLASPPDGFVLSARSDYHAQYHAVVVRQYLFRSKSDHPQGITIELVAADCASSAMVRESLIDILASQMVNRLLRLDRPEISEIVFAPEEREPTYLLFTKGLWMIQLRNIGDIYVSVERFAKDLVGSSAG